jgi:hypothetical protein
VSAGGGFHSNDGRGATITRDPVSGDPVEPVDPLARAKGTEAGIRTLALPGLHTTFAVWGPWIDSELLFIGDAGTTEPSRPSHRLGVEWDADYRVRPWLTLDASLAYSRARFTDDAPEGDRIPGAIEGVASAGITMTPSGPWGGSLRWRHFGARPLVEDNSVRSRASNLVSAEVGYQLTRAFRLKADFLNLSTRRVPTSTTSTRRGCRTSRPAAWTASTSTLSSRSHCAWRSLRASEAQVEPAVRPALE